MQDAAGASASEVVGGGGLAVAPVQQQFVAVLLRLEAENAVSSAGLCVSPWVTA